MDVNGFTMHIKQAIHIDKEANRHPDHVHHNAVDNACLGIKVVSLKALGEAFKKHSSWADLKDPNSNFT